MIIFENDEVIDFDCITSFGVSVKDEGAIGFFGTGLKYALAICAREGIPLTIYLGNQSLRLGKRQKTIRGKTFSFITLGDHQLGFTTHVGANWDRWMAFRELYCNTMDEGGRVYSGSPEPAEHKTVIAVDGFDDVYYNLGEYILQTEPMIQTASVDVHPGQNSSMFYRTIRAMKLEYPSVFSYNIKAKSLLTEDRQFRTHWEPNTYIRNLVCQYAENKRFIEEFVTASQQTYEGETSFSLYSGQPSDAFLSVMESLRMDHSGRVNKTALELYRRTVKKDILDEEPDSMTELETQTLLRAKKFLSEIGFPIHEEIIFFNSLGNNIHGQAKDDKIIITRPAFRKGLREVVLTLLEEHIHNSTGLLDETRAMQTHLFELLIEAKCEAHGVVL